MLYFVIAAAPLHVFANEGKDDALSKATSYFFLKQFDAAEPLLRRAIEERPDNAEAHAYLGDILLVRKKYDEALSHYLASLEINPSCGENYFRIGQIYYYKRDGAQAVDYFKKAMQADRKLSFAYYHIGLTYLMLLRDKARTIENWETYLSIAPDDPQYPRIKRAIELLKDPHFIIPPPDSAVSVEEALLLGGMGIDRTVHDIRDQEAGHETKKTKRDLEDIYLEDDM